MKAKPFRLGVTLFLISLNSLFLSACAGKTWTGMVTDSIAIAAPPEEVFAYLDDPKNYSEFFLGFQSVECEGNGEDESCRVKAEIFGQTYEMNSVVVDYVADRRKILVVQSDNGDVSMKLSFIIRPQPQGTRLIFINEILSAQVPAAFSGLPHATIQARINERLEEELKLIKAAVEN